MSSPTPQPGQPSAAAATDPLLLPRRSQPLIAAGVAAALVAMAAWYVGLGGFSGGLVHHDAPPAATRGFTVNVNAAGFQELAQLPGLGPATAQRIIDHRRQHGPFASLDDLLDVPGIGAATLDQMRPHLRPIRPREAGP
jgi:competence ComEA-like helix-hairpin-helix protein